MASSKARSKTKAKAKRKAKTKAPKKATARKPNRAKAPARAAKPSPRKAASAPRATEKGLSLVSVGPSFTVDNVQKSLAWYRDVMGFTVGKRWEEKGELLGVELKAGAMLFMIGQDDWNKGRDRVKGAGFRVYCETDQDVDRLADGIKARGGSLMQEPRDEEWGARAFSVQDPDGFKITISKDR